VGGGAGAGGDCGGDEEGAAVWCGGLAGWNWKEREGEREGT
jgi:hypothetical protein